MITIFANRACSILYELLISQGSLDKYYLIPANVCPIVVATFLKANKKFEFIDINKEDFCICQETVLEKLETNPEKYNGVLFVRTYGTHQNFENFFERVKFKNKEVLIIDDFCLARPFMEPQPTKADVQLFSSGYSKYINLNYGGYAFISEKIKYQRVPISFLHTDYEKLLMEFNYAIQNQTVFNYFDSDWLDSRIPEINFSTYKESIYNKMIITDEKRKILNSFYFQNIIPSIQMDKVFQNWRFHILVPEKNILVKELFENNLYVSSQYPSAAKMFLNTFFTNSEYFYNYTVALFNDERFDLEKAEKIISIINNHVLKYSLT
jgi:dTDP-4-amino-4,6-dideoxygalactose transaminase